jgi:hypothetical protein
MKAAFFKAVRMAFLGLLIGPGLALALVLGAVMFDPKCGVGDSGGCAMGVVAAPLAAALPSMALFFAASLFWEIWKLDRDKPLK